MLEFSMRSYTSLHLSGWKRPFFPRMTLTRFARLRIHQKSPSTRSSLMGTNGSTPETKKLTKYADGESLHRVDSYNLTTSNNNTWISKSCKHSDQLQYYCSGINCCRISVQYSTTCSFMFLPILWYMCLRSCNNLALWICWILYISLTEFSFGTSWPSENLSQTHVPSSLW